MEGVDVRGGAQSIAGIERNCAMWVLLDKTCMVRMSRKGYHLRRVGWETIRPSIICILHCGHRLKVESGQRSTSLLLAKFCVLSYFCQVFHQV